MFKEMSRCLTLLCGIGATVLGAPGESQAFFGWFKRHCACQQVSYASYSLTTPCATQTCQYVPQTAYRVNYVTVPVTTYRPVVACGACGQQVVTMRPLIAYTRQAQIVPYQTYRLACSAAPVAAAAYAAPAVGYAAPAISYAAPAAGAACCNGGTSSLAPTATYAGPAYSSAAPGGTITSDGAATVAPSLPPGYSPNGSTAIQGSSTYLPGYAPYGSYPSSTYPPASGYPQSSIMQQTPAQGPQPAQNGPQETYRHQTNGSQSQAPANQAPASPPTTESSGDPRGLVPIPDRNTNGGDSQGGVNGVESSHERGAGPMIPDPESRSTQNPSGSRWWAYSPVSLPSSRANPAAAELPRKTTNDGGWRPSKR
jgi:hypothetical protein